MIALFLALLLQVGVRDCACDVTRPETLESKQCSLCKLAEAQSPDKPFFVVKDANATKPNRMLILPRAHYPGPHSLAQMSAADRTAWWTAAIAKGKELWGDEWALAYNGEERRTQCHGHIHIGKLSPDAQKDGFVVVSSPAEIPVPSDGSGLWIHPVGNKLYVHAGEQVTEFNLMR